MDDLHHRFEFHAGNETTVPKHEEVRRLCSLVAENIVELTPAGREQSLAVTHIETAMFWANAAIARAEGGA